MIEIRIKTHRRIEAVDITSEVSRALGAQEGRLVHLFCLHTTCGLTINENADPDVMRDVMDGLNRLVPENHGYRHGEGNSDAHIKSSLMGCSLSVPLQHGHLALGTWQGVYLMEFDGPRERRVVVTIVK
jgi:secondary thiamine-phosphate synthase enzyme